MRGRGDSASNLRQDSGVRSAVLRAANFFRRKSSDDESIGEYRWTRRVIALIFLVDVCGCVIKLHEHLLEVSINSAEIDRG